MSLMRVFSKVDMEGKVVIPGNYYKLENLVRLTLNSK